MLSNFFLPSKPGTVHIYYIRAMLTDPDIAKLYREVSGNDLHHLAALAIFPDNSMEWR